MDRESLEIVQMVEQGQVSAEEGAKLLQALRTPPKYALEPARDRPRLVRVRVDVKAEGGEKVAVNVNLPVALADLALKLAEGMKIQKGGESITLGDYVTRLSGVDVGAALQMVKEGAEGKLVDVEVDDPGGDKVKVEVTVD